MLGSESFFDRVDTDRGSAADHDAADGPRDRLWVVGEAHAALDGVHEMEEAGVEIGDRDVDDLRIEVAWTSSPTRSYIA